MTSKHRSAVGILALVLASLILAAVAVEAAYRAFLWSGLRQGLEREIDIGDVTFHAFDRSVWRYHRAAGYDYNTNIRFSHLNVVSGQVKDCATNRFINHRGELSAPAPPADAAFRIIVFGDSFSANTMGDPNDNVEWPYAMAAALTRRLSAAVEVINLARDGYGVIQMVTLAAETLATHDADLLVFAFIWDDLLRTNQWMAEVENQPFRRVLVGSTPDFEDLSTIPHDRVVLHDGLTEAWCEQASQLVADGRARDIHDDPIFQDVVSRYRSLRRLRDTPRIAIDFLTLTDSFAINLLRHKDPYLGRAPYHVPEWRPQLTLDDYRDSPGMHAAMQKIQAANIPVSLIYLPHYVELTGGPELPAPDGGAQVRALLASLEAMTGPTAIRLEDFLALDGRDIRGLMLDPEAGDFHPNPELLRLFGEAAAAALIENGLVKPGSGDS